jgi:transposase
MKPRVPADPRERAFAAVAAGMARPEVARAYGVSRRTLDEHRAAWERAAGVRVGRSTMARALARLDPTRKKDPDRPRARRGGALGVAGRAGRGRPGRPRLPRRDRDPDHPDPPLRPRPARRAAVGRVPRGRREHVSWLATLTPAGVGESVLVPGPVDRAAFEAFVERLLVPSLRPGQAVVLDNLSVHKSAAARAAVEAAGCRLVFLPTYSPDFNPIEQAFAKCKAALRKAEPAPSTPSPRRTPGPSTATPATPHERHYFRQLL